MEALLLRSCHVLSLLLHFTQMCRFLHHRLYPGDILRPDRLLPTRYKQVYRLALERDVFGNVRATHQAEEKLTILRRRPQRWQSKKLTTSLSEDSRGVGAIIRRGKVR